MIVKQKILFTKEECKSIIWDENEDITNWNRKDRKYNSHSILYKDNTAWIFDRLKNFFESQTNIKIRKIKEKIHFHKYDIGDWFDIHNDDKDGRIYSVGVLLNQDFDGGDFILLTPNELKLDKVTGNTYLFDARINHKISPIEKDKRYSLIWFLQSEHLELKKENLI